jgi:hypothetical protein
MRKYRNLMVAATAFATLAMADRWTASRQKPRTWTSRQLGSQPGIRMTPMPSLPCFTDDAVYEDVTLGVVNHGSAELRAFAEGFFIAVPDVKFDR